MTERSSFRGRRRSRRGAAAVASVLLLASVAWGVFAFGAVYAWAYWPLAATAAVTGVLGLLVTRGSPGSELRGPAIALGTVIAAALIQLAPLPLPTLEAVSPSTTQVLRQIDPALAAGLIDRHPLSIRPGLTLTAAGLLACWSLAALGSARLFSRTGAVGFVQTLTVIGVLVALVGIVQAPLFTGTIYGFWRPLNEGNPFGPFVNRNHFAGWMLMAIPTTLGLWIGSLAQVQARLRPEARARLLWLSTPEASRLLLYGAAILTMGVALLMTMSRSGMVALAAAAMALSLVAVRRQPTWTRRLATIAGSVAAVALLISWVGLGRIEDRFVQETDGATTRLGAWSDAWQVVRDFPLAGTGLNTYGVATLLYQRHEMFHHYAQAHNDYLQLAAEGGMLLIVPVVAAGVAIILAIRRRFAEASGARTFWIRAGAVTGLFAVGVQELFEFSLQMPGNALLFAVLCGIALHRPWPDTAGPYPSPRSASVAA